MRASHSSTQFYADQIEQLDLALDQLAVGDRNFDRFAMLLVDNVVELALHRLARAREYHQRLHAQVRRKLGRKSEADDKEEERLATEAIGQHFDAKVRLARSINVISPEVADAVLNLHDFRNTAHHRGLRHEGILHSLTLHYFKTACGILRDSYGQSGFVSSSSLDTIPLRSMKYLGASPSLLGDAGDKPLHAVWQRLIELADALGDTLAIDLHEDLSETVDSVDDAMNFLVENGPWEFTRDQVMVEVQLAARADSAELRQYAAASVPGGDVAGIQYIDWLRANFPWPVKVDPVPGWRGRLDSLKREQNPNLALKKYCDFLTQTEELREVILGGAADLEGAIQNQIDRARGK